MVELKEERMSIALGLEVRPSNLGIPQCPCPVPAPLVSGSEAIEAAFHLSDHR